MCVMLLLLCHPLAHLQTSLLADFLHMARLQLVLL